MVWIPRNRGGTFREEALCSLLVFDYHLPPGMMTPPGFCVPSPDKSGAVAELIYFPLHLEILAPHKKGGEEMRP